MAVILQRCKIADAAPLLRCNGGVFVPSIRLARGSFHASHHVDVRRAPGGVAQGTPGSGEQVARIPNPALLRPFGPQPLCGI